MKRILTTISIIIGVPTLAFALLVLFPIACFHTLTYFGMDSGNAAFFSGMTTVVSAITTVILTGEWTTRSLK